VQEPSFFFPPLDPIAQAIRRYANVLSDLDRRQHATPNQVVHEVLRHAEHSGDVTGVELMEVWFVIFPRVAAAGAPR
jgi:hypothetical protein